MAASFKVNGRKTALKGSGYWSIVTGRVLVGTSVITWRREKGSTALVMDLSTLDNGLTISNMAKARRSSQMARSTTAVGPGAKNADTVNSTSMIQPTTKASSSATN